MNPNDKLPRRGAQPTIDELKQLWNFMVENGKTTETRSQALCSAMRLVHDRASVQLAPSVAQFRPELTRLH